MLCLMIFFFSRYKMLLWFLGNLRGLASQQIWWNISNLTRWTSKGGDSKAKWKNSFFQSLWIEFRNMIWLNIPFLLINTWHCRRGTNKTIWVIKSNLLCRHFTLYLVGKKYFDKMCKLSKARSGKLPPQWL